MCGRYTLKTPPEAIASHFAVAEFSELRTRFNIAPTQLAPAVLCMESGRRSMAMLRWGLVPHWAKDASMGVRMINARVETISEKPAFREPFKSRRCLVPADGFYEWEKQGTERTPYYFQLSESQPFGMAGLWDEWHDPNGSPLHTFTIITREANAAVAPIHERMPVIVSPSDYEAWLSGETMSVEDRLALLDSALSEQLTRHEVGRAVGNPRHDAPDCIEPVGGKKQGFLFDM